MNPANLWNNVLKKTWEIYAEDVGKSLIHLGALGWFLSAAAQIRMIVCNKDIDKKEKQFLVPQEIADGVINVGLYYTICQMIKTGTEQVLESGKIMTQRSFDTVMKLKNSSTSVRDFIEAMNEVIVARNFLRKAKRHQKLSNFYNGSLSILEKFQDRKSGGKNSTTVISNATKREKIFERNPILRETFENIFKNGQVKQTKGMINRAAKEYMLFKNGVGVIAAVGASVLACNIITPITRNITANHFQKKALHKNFKQNPINQQKNNYYNTVFPNTFNGFKI